LVVFIHPNFNETTLRYSLRNMMRNASCREEDGEDLFPFLLPCVMDLSGKIGESEFASLI